MINPKMNKLISPSTGTMIKRNFVTEYDNHILVFNPDKIKSLEDAKSFYKKTIVKIIEETYKIYSSKSSSYSYITPPKKFNIYNRKDYIKSVTKTRINFKEEKLSVDANYSKPKFEDKDFKLFSEKSNPYYLMSRVGKFIDLTLKLDGKPIDGGTFTVGTNVFFAIRQGAYKGYYIDIIPVMSLISNRVQEQKVHCKHTLFKNTSFLREYTIDDFFKNYFKNNESVSSITKKTCEDIHENLFEYYIQIRNVFQEKVAEHMYVFKNKSTVVNTKDSSGNTVCIEEKYESVI